MLMGASIHTPLPGRCKSRHMSAQIKAPAAHVFTLFLLSASLLHLMSECKTFGAPPNAHHPGNPTMRLLPEELLQCMLRQLSQDTSGNSRFCYAEWPPSYGVDGVRKVSMEDPFPAGSINPRVASHTAQTSC